MRITACIGGADHAPERMTGEVRPLDAEFLAQLLQVPDQVVERIGGRGRRRLAVAPQIVAHAAEVPLEAGDETVPAVPGGTDAVNENQRRPAALDRIRGSAASSGPPAPFAVPPRISETTA